MTLLDNVSISPAPPRAKIILYRALEKVALESKSRRVEGLEGLV